MREYIIKIETLLDEYNAGYVEKDTFLKEMLFVVMNMRHDIENCK